MGRPRRVLLFFHLCLSVAFLLCSEETLVFGDAGIMALAAGDAGIMAPRLMRHRTETLQCISLS